MPSNRTRARVEFARRQRAAFIATLGDPAPTRQAQLARARRLLSEGILSEQEIAGVLGWSVIEVRRAASERIDLQQESGDHE